MAPSIYIAVFVAIVIVGAVAAIVLHSFVERYVRRSPRLHRAMWLTFLVVMVGVMVKALMDILREEGNVRLALLFYVIVCGCMGTAFWLAFRKSEVERRARERWSLDPIHCPHCQYNLSGNAAAMKCPECGWVIPS